MAIPRYDVAGYDFEIEPMEDGDFYKAEDVIAIIREACGDETKDDIVGILAEAFDLDVNELNES
jgi:hypothetical protein